MRPVVAAVVARKLCRPLDEPYIPDNQVVSIDKVVNSVSVFVVHIIYLATMASVSICLFSEMFAEIAGDDHVVVGWHIAGFRVE